MRKFIILAAALVPLVVPTAAMAVVTVDASGYGFVGKGDVQTALGGLTDAQMQAKFKAGEVKFTTGYTWSVDYLQQCSKIAFVNGAVKYVPVSTTHTIISAPITQDAKVTANTNNAGKLTNGWNVNGFDGAETTGASTYTQGTCPAGSFIYETLDQDTIYGPRSVLQVNGVDLPNTPVEPVVEPVA
jgi:hypothetical protein